MLASLCCLVVGATIYNLWRNCNEIRHGGHPLSEEKILQHIYWEVQARVAGKWKFCKMAGNVELCYCWGVDADVVLV